MTRVQRLRHQAKESATWRGHQLVRWVAGTRSFLATCRDCKMAVCVIPEPYANEIDIRGEAVALNCPGKV